MHRSKVAGLAALLCSVASVTLGVARANPLEGMGSLQVGVHGGTLGLGVNAGLDISEKFAARGMFNTFRLDYEETESGNEYKGRPGSSVNRPRHRLASVCRRIPGDRGTVPQ